MIVIRTYASPSKGIGHLARCRRLANNLNNQGIEVFFALDYVDDYLQIYLKNFNCLSIYSWNESFQSEVDDAFRLYKIISNKEVSAVIVDDYRFSKIWERSIGKLGYKIIVIDDEDKNSHECHLLIDSIWEGQKTFKRHKDKILKNTVCLLGPNYLLIDEIYGFSQKPKYKSISKNKKLKILLSVGGGYHFKLLTNLIYHLINQLQDNFLYEIAIVVGPYALNKNELNKYSQNYDNVRLIVNQDGLFNEICNADLYIGASGGTLFEALAMNTPCLTFSISENQKNENEYLEDLGHFFHLNKIDENDFEKFAILVFEILSQYDRFNKIYKAASRFKIDGKGVQRVSEAILSIISKKKVKIDSISLETESKLKTGYDIKEINDFEVNRYFLANNIKINKDRAIDTTSISQLNHYIWWLKGRKRTSYILRKNGKDFIYVWHKIKKFENLDVIASGWFFADESSNNLDVIYALTEHSKIIKKLFNDFIWLIVIRKNDYFMKKVYKQLGFLKAEKGSDVERAILDSFPNASNDVLLKYFCRVENNCLNDQLNPKAR